MFSRHVTGDGRRIEPPPAVEIARVPEPLHVGEVPGMHEGHGPQLARLQEEGHSQGPVDGLARRAHRLLDGGLAGGRIGDEGRQLLGRWSSRAGPRRGHRAPPGTWCPNPASPARALRPAFSVSPRDANTRSLPSSKAVSPPAPAGSGPCPTALRSPADRPAAFVTNAW